MDNLVKWKLVIPEITLDDANICESIARGILEKKINEEEGVNTLMKIHEKYT